MNIRPSKIAYAIASILACSLLAACGGGGTVRNSPPQVNPPSASSLPPDTVACPPTADCTLDIPNTYKFLAAVTSTHALDKQGPGWLLLSKGTTYRFAGGTTIHDGGISVGNSTLQSDINVAPGAILRISGDSGRVEGNIVNEGKTYLSESAPIAGNVDNRSLISVEGGSYQILGDFRQSGTGTYSIALPPAGRSGAIDYPRLDVYGMAHLAGTLQLNEIAYDRAWGELPLPATGLGYHIIHASGGVFGTFDRWTSPGLFIEGSLRYGSNDVWFDLTRISLQAAASANGFGSPLTLASAGNIDRALAAADGFTGNPGVAQQQFLASAGRLLWMRDPLQARHALDSLSGLPQAQALDAAMHEAGMSPALSAHLDRRARAHAAGAWSQASVAGTQTGFDQWLSPRLLVGVHAARDDAQAHASLQASMQGDARVTGAYLRWFGNDGWYAGADAGYAQRTMLLDRPIDFGVAGRWNAHSRRTLDVAGLGGETGRRLSFAGGSLTPFLRLDAGAVRGADTIEQGGSGFELALNPVTQRRLAASTGLRYARNWRFADGGWLQLQAGGGMQQTLWQGGDAQRAAFTGAPGAWFDLPGVSQRRSSWFDLGLHGGFSRDWRWAMQGMRGNGIAGTDAWQLRLARNF